MRRMFSSPPPTPQIYITIAMAIIGVYRMIDEVDARRCAIIMRDARNIITIDTFAESDSSRDDVIHAL